MEQKRQIAAWVKEERSLAEIQRSLQEEFGVVITYMDLRFLVDDLDLNMPDKPPAHFASEGKLEDARGDAGPDDADFVDDGDSAANSGVSGAVSVTLDRVTRPGALVSGTVRFGDGVNAQWHLDQMGRLALNPSQPGYKPSQEDVMAFQRELQRMVEQQGGF